MNGYTRITRFVGVFEGLGNIVRCIELGALA